MRSITRSVVPLVVVWAVLGVYFYAPALAQDADELQQRIAIYQQGKMPEGPTRAELQEQVDSLNSEVANLKAKLEACENPPEEGG